MQKDSVSTAERISFPKPVKVLIIDAPYYKDISDALLKGAEQTLKAVEGVSVERVSVPGALEIAAAVNYHAGLGKYDAYVVLGCVIRGESYHFEIVCNESARKIYDCTEKHHLALGNGILTVETMEQAQARAQIGGRNNGTEAAKAALSMLSLKFELGLVS